MRLQFTKMHGLGNDFVVLDGVSEHLEPEINTDNIIFLGNRRLGIGCDQVLLLEPPTNPAADFLYRIFNADGQEVGQCGNGACCIAQFVSHQKLSEKKNLLLQTQTATLQVQILNDNQSEVCIGAPDFSPAAIPLLSESPGPVHEMNLNGREITFVALTLGNPHAVIFVPDVELAEVHQLGAELQTAEFFPAGVNVSFCQIADTDSVRLRVYERGVGETQACGSGACASAAAARQLGRVGDQVKVALPGGELDICWHGSDTPIKMKGHAATVFTGHIQL